MPKKYKLGDTWQCECGKEHTLSGGYIAAHWDEEMTHTCDGCGRVHEIWRGIIRLKNRGRGQNLRLISKKQQPITPAGEKL